ncbi:MAG TPA: septum formation initiator family protein [Salinisphaera sp.]|nr:septum formation initiator family protein [Salinisphaera sp.]HET7315010.1 septum formation initiator family protein [Salinisphaera sp.]
MYRVAAIVLLIMLAGLQYRLWVGDGSLAQVYHLESMRGQIAKVNARHRARNEAMQAQIENLKSGLGASEARARAEMGMIKPDETFFLTVPGKESAPAQTTEDASGRSANAG